VSKLNVVVEDMHSHFVSSPLFRCSPGATYLSSSCFPPRPRIVDLGSGYERTPGTEAASRGTACPPSLLAPVSSPKELIDLLSCYFESSLAPNRFSDYGTTVEPRPLPTKPIPPPQTPPPLIGLPEKLLRQSRFSYVYHPLPLLSLSP